MGVPKQKWTPEEEAALRAGVDKYGPGKWRAIQKDADFGPCLVSRSNVDLKDKWRNMSVSANGLGSRDKGGKLLASKVKQLGGSQMPSMLDVTIGTKDRKLLGARYDNLVLEAILSLKDSNGSNKNQIASYIEDHYPVPSNFRRLLAPKLKFLAQQGKLIKMRQNYIISDNVVFPFEKATKQRSRKPDARPKPQTTDPKWQQNEGNQMSRFSGDPTKKIRGYGSIKLKVDADASRFKAITAAEASRIAAQAVAEAEAAAAAAEEAARAAEIAEAEWEAAEAAAELAAALASGNPRKIGTFSAGQEGITVTG